ncbi:hypothetical protein [Methanothrix soehngenii]
MIEEENQNREGKEKSGKEEDAFQIARWSETQKGKQNLKRDI